MAILSNGYVNVADVYAFARLRYPNNFPAPAPDDAFTGAVATAGDIVNSNSKAFVGEPRAGLTGGRTWPRQPIGGGSELPYLTATVPDALLRGYEWLVIAAALSPEIIGHNTNTTASGSQTNTSSAAVTGVLKRASWGNLMVEYENPSQTTTTTTQAGSDLTDHLRWHYEQASVFLSQLLKPGAELRLPGIDRDAPKPEKAYYTLSDLC